MEPLRIGVLAETAPGERRVALTPDGVGRLGKAGAVVTVETTAGEHAFYGDGAYAQAGAAVASREDVLAAGDVLLCVAPPADRGSLRAGQVLVGLLRPLAEPALAAFLAAEKVTAVSLDTLPRTLSRAQAMDALSSQANVAGYKAVLVAADTYGGYFPMLMTAAGTTRPAQVLVLGAGVAGLQAVATARRLGALVTAYDVREAAHADIRSTGATLLDLGTSVSATGEGGYARALGEDEARAQQEAMAAAAARFDVVITTAQVPGRRPPLMISAAALSAMAPGSVVVDLAASAVGGNVEGSLPDREIRTPRGVTVIGAGNLPSAMPRAASVAYSRNITALLGYLIRDGALWLDADDEICAGVLVTRDGEIIHPQVRAALQAIRTENPA